MISSKVGAAVRSISTTASRQYTKPKYGPGSNVPFRVDNHYRIVLVFTAYCASGLALPYLVVRHQLLKGQ